jgi:fatty acid desaturase
VTHHNITSNEAHEPSAHVRIHVGRPRRRRAPAGVKTFLWSAAGVGAIASLIDTIIGQPVCLVLCVVGLAAWRFWPTRP